MRPFEYTKWTILCSNRFVLKSPPCYLFWTASNVNVKAHTCNGDLVQLWLKPYLCVCMCARIHRKTREQNVTRSIKLLEDDMQLHRCIFCHSFFTVRPLHNVANVAFLDIIVMTSKINLLPWIGFDDSKNVKQISLYYI